MELEIFSFIMCLLIFFFKKHVLFDINKKSEVSQTDQAQNVSYELEREVLKLFIVFWFLP